MTSQEAAGDDNIQPDKRIANKTVNGNGRNMFEKVAIQQKLSDSDRCQRIAASKEHSRYIINNILIRRRLLFVGFRIIFLTRPPAGLGLLRRSAFCYSLVDLPSHCPMSRVTLGTIVQAGEANIGVEEAETIDETEFKLRQFDIQRREKLEQRRKSQWTVICVACGFFTSCLVLVAGMLSITSEYQVLTFIFPEKAETLPAISATILIPKQDQKWSIDAIPDS